VETKSYNFRLPPQVNEHLSELASISGMTRTQFVVSAIETEWDKYQGNPKMKKLMEQLQVMRTQMLDVLGQAADMKDGGGDA